MTRDQMLAQADLLDAQAKTNDAYARAMERTTERTGGRLGHLNNPSLYAAHVQAAAAKRAQAADLHARAKAPAQAPAKEETQYDEARASS